MKSMMLLKIIMTELKKILRMNGVRKGSFVELPLQFFAKAFTQIFAWIVGFDWLLRLIGHLPLPNKTLTLPTIKYSPTEGFHRDRNKYKVNLLNFLFVPINYLMRNLGRLIGYVIASIFTVPAYLVIKGYYSAKGKYLE